MEIVILMEKEKRTLSYVRIYLSSEPPYTADWRLIKEKFQPLSFALTVSKLRRSSILVKILLLIIHIRDPSFEFIPAALNQVHP